MLRARHNWLAGALLLASTGAGAADGW